MTDLRTQLQAAYRRKVEGTVIDTIRTVALDASAGVVLATPVDTGRARANWNVSVNRVDRTITDKTVMPNIMDAVREATATFKITDTLFLTNNLPYIRRLNNGSSRQAPAMFVEKAVLVAKNRAKRNVNTEVSG